MFSVIDGVLTRSLILPHQEYESEDQNLSSRDTLQSLSYLIVGDESLENFESEFLISICEKIYVNRSKILMKAKNVIFRLSILIFFLSD